MEIMNESRNIIYRARLLMLVITKNNYEITLFYNCHKTVTYVFSTCFYRIQREHKCDVY